MSDTPETDAAILESNGQWSFVLKECCKRLERERDEARESGGITFLLAEKHALENELEAMTCKAAGWQNQAELNARLLVECREKAERYRLEANVMMAKLHELQTYADKLADGLPDGMLPKDVENLRIANAGLAEDLHKVEREHDTACRLLAQMHAAAVGEIQGPDIDPVTDILNLRKDRDQWRECAEGLIDYAHESLAELGTWGNGYERYERQMEQIRADIAEFERLKGESK